MNKLQNLRNKIDNIDKDIVKLIEKRMKISYEIGQYKKENNIPIFDEKREKEVLDRKKELLENKDLSSMIIDIYNIIMNKSKDIQK